MGECSAANCCIISLGCSHKWVWRVQHTHTAFIIHLRGFVYTYHTHCLTLELCLLGWCLPATSEGAEISVWCSETGQNIQSPGWKKAWTRPRSSWCKWDTDEKLQLIWHIGSIWKPTLGQVPGLWRVVFFIVVVFIFVGFVGDLACFTDVVKYCTGF